MDATHYAFEQHDGWPHDGAPGDFIGFDADMAPSLLRWRDGKWCGVRMIYLGSRSWMPEAFIRGPDTEDHVIKYAAAPTRYSELGL